MKNMGYKVSNVDATIYAQLPKLAPYIDQMRTSIAQMIHLDINDISVKATTYEKMECYWSRKSHGS